MIRPKFCLISSLMLASILGSLVFASFDHRPISYYGEVKRYAKAYPREEAIQLFDVVADPTEQNNLTEVYPENVSQLKEPIENWYPLTKRKLITNN